MTKGFLISREHKSLWIVDVDQYSGKRENFDLIVLCCDCEELDWNCGFNVKVICKGTKYIQERSISYITFGLLLTLQSYLIE